MHVYEQFNTLSLFVKTCICKPVNTRILYNMHLYSSTSFVSPVVFPEPSPNPENLSVVLHNLSDNQWKTFGRCVNMPRSELDEIEKQCSSNRECKETLIRSFISSHPAPSWILVAWGLYLTGTFSSHDGSNHKALNKLQQLFPTGKIFSYFPWCHGNTRK